MTPDRMKQAIPGYYRAWADADRDAVERFVGDPFSFTSPYDDHLDRAEFFRVCWPNAGAQESFDLKLLLPDGGDGALVLYEGRLKGGATIRNADDSRGLGGRAQSGLNRNGMAGSVLV